MQRRSRSPGIPVRDSSCDPDRATSMRSLRPNIHLRPNVICTELRDQEDKVVGSCTDAEVARRVTYWELLKLSQASPFRFFRPYTGSGNLTASQLGQMAGFMR